MNHFIILLIYGFNCRLGFKVALIKVHIGKEKDLKMSMYFFLYASVLLSVLAFIV